MAQSEFRKAQLRMLGRDSEVEGGGKQPAKPAAKKGAVKNAVAKRTVGKKSKTTKY